jgi:hypothetical protein
MIEHPFALCQSHINQKFWSYLAHNLTKELKTLEISTPTFHKSNRSEAE